MTNRVFNKRLKRQFRQIAVERRGVLAADVHGEAVLKAVLLDGKIDLDISQFVAQGNHGRLAADAVSENGGQGLGHIGNFRDVVHERLAADGIERIIQEMRVDLALQRNQRGLFLRERTFVFPLVVLDLAAQRSGGL